MFIEYGDDTGALFVDYDMLTQYVQEHGPVIPRLDGRIKIVDDTESSSLCKDSSFYCNSHTISDCNSDGTITVDAETDKKLNCYATCQYRDNEDSDSSSEEQTIIIILAVALGLVP
eukprot:UN09095